MQSAKPLFSDGRLIKIANEIGLPKITQANLQKPTKAFVCKIYDACLEITEAHVGKYTDVPEYSTFSSLDETRKLAEYRVFASHLHYLFESIECPLEFNLADIIMPEPQRARVFIAEIVNFLLTAAENCSRVNNSQERRKSNANKLELLRLQRNDLLDEEHTENSSKYERETKLQNFDSRMQEADHRRKVATEESSQLNTILAEVQADITEQIEKIDIRQRSKDDKQVKVRNLESQLVSSPDKIRSELVYLQETVGEKNKIEKSKVATLQKRKELVEKVAHAKSPLKELKTKAHKVSELCKTQRKIMIELDKETTEKKVLTKSFKDEELKLRSSVAQLTEETNKFKTLRNKVDTIVKTIENQYKEKLNENNEFEDICDRTNDLLYCLEVETNDLIDINNDYEDYKDTAKDNFYLILALMAEKLDEAGETVKRYYR